MTQYFTADLHFGHNDIIMYCKRPWKNTGKMDIAIVRNFNKILKPDDELFIIGDVTIFGSERKPYIENLVKKINCKNKYLILGNHDRFKPFDYEQVGFNSVHTILEVGPYVLRHDPAGAIVNPNKTWFCGHVHTLYKRIKNVVNVGIDQWNYYPISIEVLEAYLNKPS